VRWRVRGGCGGVRAAERPVAAVLDAAAAAQMQRVRCRAVCHPARRGAAAARRRRHHAAACCCRCCHPAVPLAWLAKSQTRAARFRRAAVRSSRGSAAAPSGILPAALPLRAALKIAAGSKPQQLTDYVLLQRRQRRQSARAVPARGCSRAQQRGAAAAAARVHRTLHVGGRSAPCGRSACGPIWTL